MMMMMMTMVMMTKTDDETTDKCYHVDMYFFSRIAAVLSSDTGLYFYCDKERLSAVDFPFIPPSHNMIVASALCVSASRLATFHFWSMTSNCWLGWTVLHMSSLQVPLTLG